MTMNSSFNTNSDSSAFDDVLLDAAAKNTRQRLRQEKRNLLINKYDFAPGDVKDLSLKELKETLHKHKEEKSKEPQLVSTTQNTGTAQQTQPYFYKDVLGGASSELTSGVSLPYTGEIDGTPVMALTLHGYNNLADNITKTMDLNKEKILTNLRGDLSRELANIDSTRSNRENLRTTMWTALANAMN